MIHLNIDHTLFPEVIIPTDVSLMGIILFKTIHTTTLTPNHTFSYLLFVMAIISNKIIIIIVLIMIMINDEIIITIIIIIIIIVNKAILTKHI